MTFVYMLETDCNEEVQEHASFLLLFTEILKLFIFCAGIVYENSLDTC